MGWERFGIGALAHVTDSMGNVCVPSEKYHHQSLSGEIPPHFDIATLGRTWEFSLAEILASNELASSTTRVVLFPERTGRPADRPDQLGQRGTDRLKHFPLFVLCL